MKVLTKYVVGILFPTDFNLRKIRMNKIFLLFIFYFKKGAGRGEEDNIIKQGYY